MIDIDKNALSFSIIIYRRPTEDGKCIFSNFPFIVTLKVILAFFDSTQLTSHTQRMALNHN
jgi:hypothetical protein